MPTIQASVGNNGNNHFNDVQTVQKLLNAHLFSNGLVPLVEDGIIGDKTIDRIHLFQKSVLKMHSTDGRIDVGGKTITELTNASAASQQSVSLSAQGIELLQSIEQLRLMPYDDQTGKDITHWLPGATIGYGHLIGNDEWDHYKNGINQTEANSLFAQDLQPFVESVKASVTRNITQQQFDALVIFTFNIGIGAMQDSSALKLINNPTANTSYPNLEAAWKAWNKSQGHIMQGLVKRREAEWNIYSKGIYQGW